MSRDKEGQKLLQLQKSIYATLKQRAMDLEGEVSSELKAYRQSQEFHAKRPIKKSNLSELLKEIEKSHIVYLGDFHSFDQSSRNLKRLVDTLSKRGRKLTLGVEFVDQKHQEQIDHYLKRNITELEFLESINYHDSWRFPWPHYKSFFELARDKKLDILALNSSGNLELRDNRADEALVNRYQSV